MSRINAVRDYWNRRPCNIRHSPKPVGSREYFEEVERRKYFVEPHIPRFAEFSRWRGASVLEIGCGIATDTISFARHGATVTAVDLSERSLEIAQTRAEVYGLSGRIRFFCANVEELSAVVPVEKYDLIYAFGVLHHTPAPERGLRELRRYGREGTVLKLMLYHRFSWKVMHLFFSGGWRHLGRFSDWIARHSEAQTGCPVTYTYTAVQARRLVTDAGFRVVDTFITHIFPYRVRDYVRYRYVKEWYFRLLPAPIFTWLETHLGWHICLTAVLGDHPREGT